MAAGRIKVDGVYFCTFRFLSNISFLPWDFGIDFSVFALLCPGKLESISILRMHIFASSIIFTKFVSNNFSEGVRKERKIL